MSFPSGQNGEPEGEFRLIETVEIQSSRGPVNIHITEFNFGDDYDYEMEQDCEVLEFLGEEAFEEVSHQQERCSRKGYYRNGKVAVSIDYNRRGGFIVTKYFPSGQKLSENVYYGCATEGGPYKEWWENGNLKVEAGYIGTSTANLWYESGHPKRLLQMACGGGLGMECVEMQLDFWPNGSLKRSYRCPYCLGVEDCPPPKCFDESGNPIEC